MTEDYNIEIDDDVQESTDGHSSSSFSRGTYANSTKAEELGRSLSSNRGDSSDEIDPRKLVRDPELSEIRWYYRRTFAKKLVDKPIDDAFKNGFDFTGASATRAEQIYNKGNYEDNYKLAEKKARRDGFALLFIGLRDNSAGVHVSPFDDDVIVDDVTHTKVLTIDDLRRVSESHILEDVQASYGEDMTIEDFHVRETGIVISTDITDPNFRDPIGYVLDTTPHGQFIHKDRIQHMVWNPEVDGDYVHDGDVLGVSRYRYGDERTLGRWEGDGILIPSYDLLKGITKGNWAIMQALFRNASNMYVVHIPRDASQEEYDAAEREFSNMNAKSEFVVPSGPSGMDEDSYEVKQYSSGDMLEPEEHFNVIFDQICASHEMTKSVLFGTQSGTVSGSETDIKNYFNKVGRNQTTRHEKFIRDYINRVAKLIDGRTSDEFELDFEIEWGPLFKVSQIDKVTAMQTQMQALNTAIGGYMLTPDEARSILSEEWAEIDLDNLTESEKDELDRINLMQVGQGQAGAAEEAEYGKRSGERPEDTGPSNNRTGGQNGGGMEQGQKTGEFADDKDE